MKKALLLLLIPVLLAGVVLFAASCDDAETPSDVPDRPLTPDDNGYWYQEENVFSPTDIDPNLCSTGGSGLCC